MLVESDGLASTRRIDNRSRCIGGIRNLSCPQDVRLPFILNALCIVFSPVRSKKRYTIMIRQGSCELYTLWRGSGGGRVPSGCRPPDPLHASPTVKLIAL